VVGINSFRSGKGTGGKYSVTANDGVDHVVFQFQAVPVKRRMNPDAANTGGYAASEMRRYLVPVDGVAGSGNFLAGLENAGGPHGVLWAPARSVSSSVDSVGEIKDLLWLPTVWEMTGAQFRYAVTSESATNQARLEYYDTFNQWHKLVISTEVCVYWTSTMDHWPGYPSDTFCDIGTGVWYSFKANDTHGVAPAFCVY
jgi:hypothetical protein